MATEVKSREKQNANLDRTAGRYGRRGKPLLDRVDEPLTAMRHVLSVPDNETLQHKELRGYLKENRSAFMQRYLDLEKEAAGLARAAAPREDGVQLAAPDEGAERLEALIGKLLASFQESDKPARS